MSARLEEFLTKKGPLAYEAGEILDVDQSNFDMTIATRDYGSDHDCVFVNSG